MKKVLVFFAEGFEDVEALTPVDFLRRAEVEVTTVGIGGKNIKSAHNVIIQTDVELSELGSADDYDGLVCPGGMPGAENIAAEKSVLDMIENFNAEGKVVAALCASPGVILAKTSVLDGKSATAYPGFEKMFGSSTTHGSERVVVDGNLITSMGPGTSAEFAVELVRKFAGDETADQIKAGTLQNF